MFKTMDGVPVYDQQDVDGIIQATKDQIDETKVSHTEMNDLVRTTVDSVISEKVNEVAKTFNDTIDAKVSAAVTNEDIPGKINTALAGYDDSSTVDSKISTAIANIPSGPAAMTTAEATALIDQYL